MSVTVRPESREVIKNWMPGSGAEDYVVSASVEARKPLGKESVKVEEEEDFDLPLCLQ